jgi:O-antigen/teichoic acid export membrane protein
MADEQFHSAYVYVPVLLVGNMFFMSYWYTQIGILLEKKTRYLGIAAILGALLNVGSNLLLIPRLGAWGATISTLISFMFFFAFTTYFAQRLYRIPYEMGRIVKMAVAAVILYVAAWYITLDNVVVSLIVRTILTLCFPLLLYPLGFYSEAEKKKLSELAGRVFRRGAKEPVEGKTP